MSLISKKMLGVQIDPAEQLSPTCAVKIYIYMQCRVIWCGLPAVLSSTCALSPLMA